MAALRFLATLLMSIALACPSTWALEYPQCKGSKQSPISLGKGISDSTFLGYFYDQGLGSGPRTLTVTNTGEIIRIDGKQDDAYFFGASLPGADVTPWEWSAFETADRYIIDHFIIHWGKENGRGSEHVLNGDREDGEVQIVTYNNKYSSFEEARTKKDGVSIIAYLIKVNGDAYPDVNFDKLAEALQHVQYKGQSHEFTVERLADLIPRGYVNWYHRYRGSFTMPPCEETVVWSVVNDVLPISQAQMDAFRSLYASKAGDPKVPLGDNYRDVQDLDGREVQYSDFVTNGP